MAKKFALRGIYPKAAGTNTRPSQSVCLGTFMGLHGAATPSPWGTTTCKYSYSVSQKPCCSSKQNATTSHDEALPMVPTALSHIVSHGPVACRDGDVHKRQPPNAPHAPACRLILTMILLKISLFHRLPAREGEGAGSCDDVTVSSWARHAAKTSNMDWLLPHSSPGCPAKRISHQGTGVHREALESSPDDMCWLRFQT